MTQPSPAQARLLLAMSSYPYARVLWNGYQAKVVGPDSWKLEEQLKKAGVSVRSSTIRAVTREGWLESDDGDPMSYRLSAAGREALGGLSEDDFRPPVPLMTALDVQWAMRSYFPAPEWWYLSEVALLGWKDRRVDGLALQLAGRHEVWAVEVKVERGDFLRELDEPMKRVPAMQLAHCFAFAAPAGLIGEHELPDGTGLIEVHSRTHAVLAVQPPYSRPERPTWELVAALGRAALRSAA